MLLVCLFSAVRFRLLVGVVGQRVQHVVPFGCEAGTCRPFTSYLYPLSLSALSYFGA